MKKVSKLGPTEIKALSRSELERAYLLLLKISKMKSDLIVFLERSVDAEPGPEDSNAAALDHQPKQIRVSTEAILNSACVAEA